MPNVVELDKKPATQVQSAGPGRSLTVVRSYSELEQHEAAWEDLANHATEINVYYEPALLLPAVKYTQQQRDLLFVLIYDTSPTPQLLGMFPLERQRGLFTKLRMWDYDYCYLCTPLIRKGFAATCWTMLLDWIEKAPGIASLLELPMFPAEGPVFQELVELIRRRGLLTFEVEKFTRATFIRRSAAEAYLDQSLSASKRRDLKRKWRRLEEHLSVDTLVHGDRNSKQQTVDTLVHGDRKTEHCLEFRHLDVDSDLNRWVSDFLQLEASGWKHAEGTAIACKPNGPEFFREACSRLHALGNLQMLGLFLDGVPIAMRCNFLSAPGSFFFKPAYDEEYAKYSPGVHVEVETIRALHDLVAVNWMDSCTSPDNTLLNSLWLERRTFQTLQIATRGVFTGCLLSSIKPTLRWLNRTLGRYQKLPDPS